MQGEPKEQKADSSHCPCLEGSLFLPPSAGTWKGGLASSRTGGLVVTYLSCSSFGGVAVFTEKTETDLIPPHKLSLSPPAAPAFQGWEGAEALSRPDSGSGEEPGFLNSIFFPTHLFAPAALGLELSFSFQ